MKIVIQRVQSASVVIEDSTVGAIKHKEKLTEKFGL